MASCSLGAPNVKLPKLDLGRAKVGNLQQQNSIRTWIGRRQVQYAHLAVSHEAKKAFRIRCGPSVEAKMEEVVAHTVDDSKETKLSGSRSKFIPNSSQVQSLVSDICDTTSIAEFELKLGGFRLYVKRNTVEKSISPAQTLSPVVESVSAPAPSPSPAPASAPGDLNGSASKSLAITKLVPTSGGIQSFIDRAADEGLVIVQSPRVGFFRRSRTIKGKRAPPPCKEKQIVKEGQVVCFIEQLGGELPIESDVSGEVIKILREDGEPVGYGDALVAILPSFPGIKKLQ